MHTVRDIFAGTGCFVCILLACDFLLTLHDIRNELRSIREDRENGSVLNSLF